MPNPNSSGTGFLDVSSWIQLWGEDAAWSYMDALHENIMQYTHSGSAPCRQAASGEAVVGISFAYRGARLKEQGASIEIIAPSEGVGWDLEAFAIVDGTRNLEAAQTLADWSISRQAKTILPGLPSIESASSTSGETATTARPSKCSTASPRGTVTGAGICAVSGLGTFRDQGRIGSRCRTTEVLPRRVAEWCGSSAVG